MLDTEGHAVCARKRERITADDTTILLLSEEYKADCVHVCIKCALEVAAEREKTNQGFFFIGMEDSLIDKMERDSQLLKLVLREAQKSSDEDEGW